MSDLRISLRQDRTAFEPGEELNGAVLWKFDEPPIAVELRLFWFTRGKGTEDADVVKTVRFDQPLPEEVRPFGFRLPAGPYSFSGKLISLVWAFELVAEPSQETARMQITVAPGGHEARLDSVPASELNW
jgi:hypothetical protein